MRGSLPFRFEKKEYGVNFEISWLDAEGLEFSHSFPWLISDRLAGPLLGRYIEFKSLLLIKKKHRQGKLSLQEDEIEALKRKEKHTEFLSAFRKNFGEPRLSELFRLRTFGFNRASPLMAHLCQRVANAEALDDV